MRKTTLIKHIEALEAEELRNEIIMLYNKFKTVKEYYAMELGAEKEREKLFVKAKKNIKSKYESKSYYRPKRPRISKINKLLSEMDKVSIFKEEMADLYLYNCECALEFIIHYQYHSQPIHNSVSNSFKKASMLIAQSSTLPDFRERCASIIDKSFEAYDHLGYILQDQYYSAFDEE